MAWRRRLCPSCPRPQVLATPYQTLAQPPEDLLTTLAPAPTHPAPQVLKTPQKTLVSSIFFMCLPDKARATEGLVCGVG